MTNIPRSEYPRPQFVRQDWLCLNGEWQFEMDPGDSGLSRNLLEKGFSHTITVPFCMESELSGIGYTDFCPAVWYRREVEIPAEWKGQCLRLHFQACDYDTTVWVNGHEAGSHRGGFSSFFFDISEYADAGETAVIVVRARDETRECKPVGKQSQRYENHACCYTRTTGIWQPVWLEPVPSVCFERPRITPDVAQSGFHIAARLNCPKPDLEIVARLKDEHGVIAEASTCTDHDFCCQLWLALPTGQARLWNTDDPYLYGIEFLLVDSEGQTIDQVESYCGLRSVTFDGKAILLNGKPVFQRLVLDQGYYPDGIMTAPSESALVEDIQISLDAGFNGARLHQKVFEERFLYHADRMGYLVWGEFGDWGCADHSRRHELQQQPASIITQWLEVLERDYSHPSIIGWCPLNETFQPLLDKITLLDDVTRAMFLATKAMDLTRPVLDTSGYAHRVPESDVYDSHDYDQNPDSFAARHAGLADGKPYVNLHDGQKQSIAYRGQPYFVSEFGGIWWNPDAKEGEDSWGYGDRPKTIEEFYTRFEGLCKALLDNPLMFGYCYTQLTDVYQEQNGVYRFNRQTKFDIERLRAVQTRVAAIEKQAPVEKLSCQAVS